MKIVHLTSAHPRYDTRIFIKICSSLASYGYEISLVVADGFGVEVINGVAIVDVGSNSGGRLSRMLKTVKRVFEAALKLNADIYHLHDPELIPIGLKLKKLGKKVIFDAHEDLPKQILVKPYLNKVSKIFLSKAFTIYENWACPKFDAIICATPSIRDKFLKINNTTIDINNFPLLNELANTSDWSDKLNEVTYVGDISKIRGIEEIVLAMNYTSKVKLNLAGKFVDELLESNLKNQQAWLKVNHLGYLSRPQLKKLLAKSKAGLVTLYPSLNYIDALPIKMFEYMAAGIPVIASDFPLWRMIVEENECGICVNPQDPEAIGDAIQYLIENPQDAERMGGNGRRAVEKKYNWLIEEKKLLRLYQSLKL